MKIVWGSLMQSEYGGYGRVGQYLAGAIGEHVDDIELAGRFDIDYDWRIIVAVPYNWVVGALHQPDLIWHTMFECTPMPSALAGLYRQARHIWVPSEFVREEILKVCPDLSIIKSGYGIDPRKFPFIDREKESLPGKRGDRPYRFFSWTDQLPSRKGPVDVMRAFNKLNLPNCELIVKSSQDSMQYSVNNPNIRFVQGNLMWFELVQVMGQCDAMVYPSRGEGFGLMPMEAMATGLCTIAPKASGMAEFIDEEYNLVLPIVGTEAVHVSGMAYQEEQFGHVPDMDTMMDMMRWCYENQHEAYLLGKKGSEYIHREWTWEQAAHRAAAELQRLGSWRDGLIT